MKTAQFFMLYLYSMIVRALHPLQRKPNGVMGEAVFLFFDPEYPEKEHGVVAFVLPQGISPDVFSPDLYGPFGYSSQITLFGYHLYGRDTWGMVKREQIKVNKKLAIIAHWNPGCTILLAGVRKVSGRHISPLDNPHNFVLPYRIH